MPADKRKTILVVDDDPDVQDLLTALLLKAGFSVSLAANGAEAIDTLENEDPPAVILTDLIMPGVIGTSLLEYIGNTHRLASIPVAIISASPELAPAGARVFKKPVSFGPILEFVTNSTRDPN